MKLIIPVDIFCPHCGVRHVDTDEWEKRAHTTHKCLSCDWEFDVYVTGAPEPDHPEPDICCKCLIVFKSSMDVYEDYDDNKYCVKCTPADKLIKIPVPTPEPCCKSCGTFVVLLNSNNVCEGCHCLGET